MKLCDHVIRYIANGLQLPEMERGPRSAKDFRKFQISEDLFYYVHTSGYVLTGKTLMTARRSPRDILKDVSRFEERNQL
jgi:hypothetical protein